MQIAYYVEYYHILPFDRFYLNWIEAKTTVDNLETW